MRGIRIAIAALAALASVSAAIPAEAQYPGHRYGRPDDGGRGWGQGWGPGPGPMMDTGPAMFGRWHGRRGAPMDGRGPRSRMGGPAEFIDGRIAFLRAELRLTDAQKSLFEAYADSLRTAAASMQAQHERMWSRDVPESLPERLQLHIDGMTARLQAATAVKAAAGPLYEALSADQRETLDDLVGPMGVM